MSEKYDPKQIESKWQKVWEENRVYKTTEEGEKPKYYILDMFPYPSGEGLHVGHPKGYIATDIVSRMKRMQGFNVLHPMGFDAFGLPAEQYAVKTKTNPAIAVSKNVARYKKQLEVLGFDYDWSREVNTTHPKYYKWTQWIFLKLLENGLAEERYEAINWCPSDKTGLANEDVEDGKCERCGTPVEKKLMRQWVLKITKYAERLLKDLDSEELDWPESIKESQRNWIGKSKGAEFDFSIRVDGAHLHTATVFTTRADTLFGVTYLVLAPEHSLVREMLEKISNKSEVEEYIQTAKVKTEIDRTDATKEKTGVELKGIKAINPANNEEVPVWIADYVLADYGTGAVMAVPAHDERDFEFAEKYHLPIIEVVEPIFRSTNKDDEIKKELPFEKRHAVVVIIKHWEEDKYLCLKWKKNDWRGFVIGGIEKDESIVDAAIREAMEETGYTSYELVKQQDGIVHSQFFHIIKNVNRWAHFHPVVLKLKNDSRNEISDEENEIHSIEWISKDEVDKYLSWVEDMRLIWRRTLGDVAMTKEGILVNSEEFSGLDSEAAKEKITEKFGRSVIQYKLRDWVFSRQRYWGEPIPVLHDESGEVIPLSESDLPLELPLVEKYEPTDNGESPLSNISEWVNISVDGRHLRRETNTMPQWAGSSWYYLRYMDPNNDNSLVGAEKEKYWNSVDLYVGGAEHATRHLIYARFWHKFLYDIGVVSTIEPFKKLANQGLILADDGRKMSKRWGNVVNPDELVETFGADALRMYEMFMGPFDQAISWNTNGVVGTRRFLEKVWRLKEKVKSNNDSHCKPAIETLLHKTIKKVSEDIEAMHFNTAVSALMIMVNDLEKEDEITMGVFVNILQMLAPFAPHMTEEIWNGLGNKESIHISSWPTYDPLKIIEDKVVIAIQINGKTRETITVYKDSDEEAVKDKVLALSGVQKWIEGKPLKKVIWLKNRIINLIID